VVVDHFDSNPDLALYRYAQSVLDIQTNCVWLSDKKGLLAISLTSGKQVYYAATMLHDDDYIAGMCYDRKRKPGLAEYTYWIAPVQHRR
jgi:hypothetical protein